jgi:hypothetical protein
MNGKISFFIEVPPPAIIHAAISKKQNKRNRHIFIELCFEKI